MKDFDYQYQRIEKIKRMTAFLTVVIFLILGIMLYTGITYRSSKKESKKQEIAKVAKSTEKSISEDKKLKVGEESTIKEGSYVSSDEEVATIDDSGKIIAKKEGFATIVGNNKEGEDVVVVVEVKGKEKETVTEQILQEYVTPEETNIIDNNIQTIIEEQNTNIDNSIGEENVSEITQDVVIENNKENGNLNIDEVEEETTPSVDTKNENNQGELKNEDIETTEQEEPIEEKTETSAEDKKEEQEKVQGQWIQKTTNGKNYWYYYDESGKVVTGWQLLTKEGEENWYYFNADGQMQTSKVVNGYTLNKTGKRVVGPAASFTNYSHLNNYNQSGKYKNYSVCASGGNTIGASACGLSTYMAVRYVLTGKDTNFLSFAHEACNTKLYNGVGTSWNVLFEKQYKNFYANKYGIKDYWIKNKYNNIVTELKKGNVVIFMIQNGFRNVEAGGFNATANGHFIALINYNEKKDSIYVYNPNKSNTGWHTKDEIIKFVIKPAKIIRSVYKIPN